MKKGNEPPKNATAWCVLHERLMNDLYIRRRGCAMRRCKHLRWLESGRGGMETARATAESEQ
jgi:hypothetical protein